MLQVTSLRHFYFKRVLKHFSLAAIVGIGPTFSVHNSNNILISNIRMGLLTLLLILTDRITHTK